MILLQPRLKPCSFAVKHFIDKKQLLRELATEVLVAQGEHQLKEKKMQCKRLARQASSEEKEKRKKTNKPRKFRYLLCIKNQIKSKQNKSPKKPCCWKSCGGTPFNPSPHRKKRADICELKANPVYMVRFRTVIVL